MHARNKRFTLSIRSRPNCLGDAPLRPISETASGRLSSTLGRWRGARVSRRPRGAPVVGELLAIRVGLAGGRKTVGLVQRTPRPGEGQRCCRDSGRRRVTSRARDAGLARLLSHPSSCGGFGGREQRLNRRRHQQLTEDGNAPRPSPQGGREGMLGGRRG